MGGRSRRLRDWYLHYSDRAGTGAAEEDLIDTQSKSKKSFDPGPPYLTGIGSAQHCFGPVERIVGNSMVQRPMSNVKFLDT